MRLRIKAFIIHLGRARERRRQVSLLERSLPVEAQIINAVDSERLTDEDIRAVYRRNLHKPSYPFPLTKSEIACFLSHRKAWQAIVDQKPDAGLVLEDDVALTAAFEAAFSLACQHLAPMSFVRFPFRMKESGPVLADNGRARLIRPTPVGLGQVAQLVSRDAAKQLLEATRCFDRPVDTMMQLFPFTGVRPLAVLPGGVKEISGELGGSTLKKRHKRAEKLYREIMRSLYRARIAVFSRRKD